MSLFIIGLCTGLGFGIIFGFLLVCGVDTLRRIVEYYRSGAECMQQVRRDDVRVRQLELLLREPKGSEDWQ